MKKGKALILSAPSGAGKSTILAHLIEKFPRLKFSISATSRAPRGSEVDGCEYYFLSEEEFREKIATDSFIEWEEVYKGSYYGTLKSEVERIWDSGDVVIFDIDVVGGVNLKKIMGENALSVFVMPPSLEELHQRLISRNTDSTEAIERRIAKAASEMEYSPKFDVILVNDNLEEAKAKAEEIVKAHIK